MITSLILSLTLAFLTPNYVWQRTLQGHQAAVSEIAFMSEDNLLASGDKNGEIILWNVQTGQIIKRLKRHHKQITQLAFSADGQCLLSAAYDGTIKVWKLPEGTLWKSYKNPGIPSYANNVQGNEPTFAVFGPDNQSIYAGGYNMKVIKIALANDQMQEVFSTEEGGITCGKLSPNGQHLVFGAAGKIYFWDLQNQALSKTLVQSSGNFDDFVCELDFVPNSSLLTSWVYGGKLHFWNTQTNDIQYSLRATTKKGTSNVAFSGDGEWLLTGNDARKIKLWNLQEKRVVQILQKHQQAVTNFAFSIDGNYIVTGSEDHTLNVWKKQTSDKPNPPHIPPVVNNRPVKVQQTLKVTQDKLQVAIWDNQMVDGDMISLSINGNTVLNKYTLRKSKKRLQIKLTQKNNYLVMYAHNEGTRRPNTAAIRIKAGTNERVVVLKSSLGTSAAINITYEK